MKLRNRTRHGGTLHRSADDARLGNMRANSIRSLAVSCSNSHRCWHRATLNVDSYADDISVTAFGPRMVCTKCGTIGPDARPNWSDR